MSVCEKVKKLLEDNGVSYVEAAEKLQGDNVAIGKYLYRGPMSLKHLVQLADLCGYKLELKNKKGVTIVIDKNDVGDKW